MESINFINNFDEIQANDSLENNALIGWSATCLDQTISYYVDCNCIEISQDDNKAS
uniref:Uncharacterized protein n=1 Tax=Acrochaetium secundatum TaxID=209631 RepID=A0A4D6BNF3_9FLOR|nr:hypothetical protein [Acrochaetium secundatum]QBX88483.1 hypothetical protein [Acrochaetium secundatum]